MGTAPTIANTNLVNTMREAWLKTSHKQIVEPNIVLAWLGIDEGDKETPKYLKSRISQDMGELDQGENPDGSIYIKESIQPKVFKGKSQAYGSKTTLTQHETSIYDTVYWLWHNIQQGMTRPLEQMLATRREDQAVDLAKSLVYEMQQGMLYDLRTWLWDCKAYTDTEAGQILSIPAALMPGETSGYIGYTYGTLTRDFSAGTNNIWQSADTEYDVARYTSTIAPSARTACNFTMDTFDKMLTAVMANTGDGNKAHYMGLCGPKLHRAGRRLVEAADMNTDVKPMHRAYGTDTYSLRGVEIVEDPLWTSTNSDYMAADASIAGSDFTTTTAGTTYTIDKWFLVLYRPSWNVWIEPSRSFKLEGPVDQRMQVNGIDQQLLRCLLRIMARCSHPNCNIWKQNMTP